MVNVSLAHELRGNQNAARDCVTEKFLITQVIIPPLGYFYKFTLTGIKWHKNLPGIVHDDRCMSKANLGKKCVFALFYLWHRSLVDSVLMPPELPVSSPSISSAESGSYISSSTRRIFHPHSIMCVLLRIQS
jgi:hypothetical protein